MRKISITRPLDTLAERIYLRVAAPVVWRPDAHLCTRWCWLRCHIIHLHGRTSDGGQCRCCRRRPHFNEREQAMTAEYPEMTTGWWNDNDPDRGSR